MAKAQYRNRTVAGTPEELKRYKSKAKKIDREEKAAILAQAKRVKARRQMLADVLESLKKERKRQGLSLADLSSLSNIDKASLSRLENTVNVNPKLDTLMRYAEALGVEMRLSVGKGTAA